MKQIEYYFWINSDWAYLGADRLEQIAQRHGATILYRPVDLPHVYSRTGGVVLEKRAKERQAYRIAELKRWCRMDGKRLLERAKEPAIVAKYREYTEQAIAAGVFGSPSYVYRGELFWGQDRLDFLEEALAA